MAAWSQALGSVLALHALWWLAGAGCCRWGSLCHRLEFLCSCVESALRWITEVKHRCTMMHVYTCPGGPTHACTTPKVQIKGSKQNTVATWTEISMSQPLAGQGTVRELDAGGHHGKESQRTNAGLLGVDLDGKWDDPEKTIWRFREKNVRGEWELRNT